MVRAPTIRGRPTPARKHKASGAASSSTSNTFSAKAAIPKALKRAEKRASLLSKAADAEDSKGARALLRDGEQSISKSSLRRRKRKARDEIGKNVQEGREGGVGDLKDAMEELEAGLEGDEGDEEEGGKGSTEPPSLGGRGKVTANGRRRVLAQEQARQSVILSDPAYKASPFAALRAHARNTLAASDR